MLFLGYLFPLVICVDLLNLYPFTHGTQKHNSSLHINKKKTCHFVMCGHIQTRFSCYCFIQNKQKKKMCTLILMNIKNCCHFAYTFQPHHLYIIYMIYIYIYSFYVFNTTQLNIAVTAKTNCIFFYWCECVFESLSYRPVE